MDLSDYAGNSTAGKILCVMRMSFFIILVTSLHLSAATYSQNVSLKARNQPLEKIFSQLERQTGYNFVYDDQLIIGTRTITVDLQDVPLERALEQCLQGTELSYVIRYKTIIVRKVLPTVEGEFPPPLLSITGKVENSRHESLEGASVLLVGPHFKRGTATNTNGSFEFKNVQEGTYMIDVSMVGYAHWRRTIGLSASMQTLPLIVLKDSVTSDKEVVVNGIYQRPAENYTGAARSYTAGQLQQVSSTSIFSALRSLDASFQMPSDINFGSDPNHLPSMQIRGSNSVAGTNLTSQYGYISNPPLFILDGFEVTQEKLFDLDMGRVKKVTILKDAAATSIYGSRAANGVLIIETTQPRKGKLRVSYNNSLGVTAPDLTSYHLLNASQKLQLEQDAGIYQGRYINGGVLPAVQQGLDELYNQRLADVKRGVNTYWLSQPLSTEFSQRHSLFLEGGDEYMRYGVDLSYNNNTGVMKGSSRNTYSGGVNLLYHKDNLQFTNYLSVTSNSSSNSPYGSFSQYSTLNPYWKVRDSSNRIGKLLQSANYENGYSLAGDVYNPMYDATLKTVNRTNYTNITENFQADWNIKRDLKLSARFSLTSQDDGGDVFLPADAVEFAATPDSLFNTRGSYSKTNGKELTYQGDLFLNYGRSFGRHMLFATVGSHIQQNTINSTTVTVQGFPNSNMDDILFGLQYPVNSVPTGSESLTRLFGYFANTSYSYDDRYLLDLSFRSDGSSQFGTNKHFAPFWSVGGGWNIHKEAFLRNNSVISRFKLRASYGSTGSQNFPSYASLQTYGYLVNDRYINSVGSTLLGLGNSNLQWQQTNKLNLGADIDLFKGYVSTSFNYYVEKTNNLFTQINTAPSSGFNSYYANLGNSQNKGMELYLTAFVLKDIRKNIFLSFYANILHNVNKLIKISDALKAQNDAAIAKQSAGTITTPVLLYNEGQSLSAIYAVRSCGIDPSTGDEIFLTKDGQQTYKWSPLDEVVVGDNQPKINGNFGSNLLYKGITLNISMHTEFGGQMYNSTLASMVENVDPHYNVDIRVLTDRWKRPGDVAQYKGLVDIYGDTRSDVTNATSRFVQRNNTLYCDAISFGYLVPQKIVSHWGMTRLQGTFYINSPFVVSSIKQERGLDYPFARTYSFALQLGF